MAQIFRLRSNSIARASLIAVILLIAAAATAVYAVFRSPYMTRQETPRPQVVPFSHEHHTGGLGIDCRYCHTSVEESAFAGIPSTDICMTCHSQLFTDEPMLAPVRQSLSDNRPLVWTRVNDLPEFVFFNHEIHVAKGIGCSTCHGPVDTMPLTWQAHSLYMKWCLECHREPARFVRPQEEIFNMNWQPPPDQLVIGRQLVEAYDIHTGHLTDCSICHR